MERGQLLEVTRVLSVNGHWFLTGRDRELMGKGLALGDRQGDVVYDGP